MSSEALRRIYYSKLGTRAALKFLNPELSRNVELARRFLSEA